MAIGAAIGAAVVGAWGAKKSADAQEDAARSASGAQTAATQASIEEQRYQFDQMQELLAPFVEGGTEAFRAQQGLLGLAGPEDQAMAIDALQQSPQFLALVDQGEEALLQRASATGGLRGGNIQSALAQFRPQLLSQTIENQLNRLGGLTQIGQASAAGVGSAGLSTGSNISNLLQQSGAAQAGSALASGASSANLYSDAAQTVGTVAGSGTLNNLFGGTSSPSVAPGLTAPPTLTW